MKKILISILSVVLLLSMISCDINMNLPDNNKPDIDINDYSSGHTYSSDKDVDCNVCGDVRELDVVNPDPDPTPDPDPEPTPDPDPNPDEPIVPDEPENQYKSKNFIVATDAEVKESTIVVDQRKYVDVILKFVEAIATNQFQAVVNMLDIDNSPFVTTDDIVYGLPRSLLTSLEKRFLQSSKMAI